MVRFTLLIILLLLSILALYKAKTYHLWLISILVTEFPLIFSGLSILLVISGIWANHYQLEGTLIGILASVLFLIPVVQAGAISKTLESQLNKAYGSDALSDKKPFMVSGMISGRNTRKSNFKEYTYCSHSDNALKLDFYSAKAEGKQPCVLVIHGGSWKSGDNKQLPELNSYLADSGYHAAVINYRLAPKYQNPSPVEDVKSALDFLQRNANDLRVDMDNIVLLGRSAGAQIALLAAYILKHPGIKGVIDFYGPADMVWGYAAPAKRLVMDSRKVMEDYLGGSYDKVPDNYAASSPLNFISAMSVPTLIIHGKNDVLVSYDHSVRLQNKLNENGVRNYILSLPWATHAFDYTLNGPGGQLSTYAVLKFLNSITRKE